MKTIAIIPAGGKGLRSGVSVPKQYIKINRKELIVYTLEAFQKNKLVDEIIISADPSYFSLLERLKKKYKLFKLAKIVHAGKERQHSVFNGLKAASAGKDDLIAVHDAARPLLPQDVLTNSILAAKKKGNALVCIKASDTLIKGNGTVKTYLDRSEISYVQTPQVFRYEDLMNAMIKAEKKNFIGTDESILIKKFLKKEIHIVEGSLINFKVTTKTDINLFKKLSEKGNPQL